jgi:hypothetical protein
MAIANDRVKDLFDLTGRVAIDTGWGRPPLLLTWSHPGSSRAHVVLLDLRLANPQLRAEQLIVPTGA